MNEQKQYLADLPYIDESNYLIQDILFKQKADDYASQLFIDFHNKLTQRLKSQRYDFRARTHIKGVTYFVNEKKKAFMIINIGKHSFSILFFTGDSNIPGLKKANWLRGDDNHGCKMVKIKDYSQFETAINYSAKAYKIAHAWPLPHKP